MKTNKKIENFLNRIPKVEIHCHLLGTIRKDTMIEIARKNCARTSADEIDKYYIRGDKPVGVLHIFRELDAHILMEPDDFYRITYEYLQGIASHSVRYAEFFWNPTGTVKKSGMTYPKVQDAILKGMADAEKDFSIVSGLIPSIDRHASSDDAVEMVRWVNAHRKPEIVGIGIDYNEVDRPPEMFSESYALAKKTGLKATAHAGEFGMPWNNVQTALDTLKVDRIDHGYTILDNPELTNRCAEQGIIVTVVPTNSYYLRVLPPEDWAKMHPIRKMGRAGIKIHPNTDDPSFHLTNPTKCWLSMYSDFDYDLDDLRELMINGLDGAWIDEETRVKWKREWTSEFDALRKEYKI